MKSATDLTSISENGEGPQYWSEHGSLLAPSSEIKQIKVLKIINVNIKWLSSKPLTMLLNLVIKLQKRQFIDIQYTRQEFKSVLKWQTSAFVSTMQHTIPHQKIEQYNSVNEVKNACMIFQEWAYFMCGLYLRALWKFWEHGYKSFMLCVVSHLTIIFTKANIHKKNQFEVGLWIKHSLLLMVHNQCSSTLFIKFMIYSNAVMADILLDESKTNQLTL